MLLTLKHNNGTHCNCFYATWRFAMTLQTMIMFSCDLPECNAPYAMAPPEFSGASLPLLEKAAQLLPAMSPRVPTGSNAQRTTNALAMDQSVTSPSSHLAGEGRIAAAVLMRRGDTTDGHSLQAPNEDDFNPRSIDWLQAVRKHTDRTRAILVDHTNIKTSFADMMLGGGRFVMSEYLALRAIQNSTERSRCFISRILPQKDYSTFKYVIKAFRDTESTALAACFEQILNDIKEDIERRHRAASSLKTVETI
jgi:hypothetical protein